MPINKIKPSARGKTAIAAALIAAAAGGWHTFKDTSATVHPPEVILAKEAIIKGWEGRVLNAHFDPFAKIYDICYGKTTLNGKPITKGMKFTPQECEQFLEDDLYADYYVKLAKQVPQYVRFPVSVKASQLAGAYNFGVGGMAKSTAMKLAIEALSFVDKGDELKKLAAAEKDDVAQRVQTRLSTVNYAFAKDRYREACEAQTAFNKAGGRVVQGLVNRREMGDAQRIGEAELCVSGL